MIVDLSVLVNQDSPVYPGDPVVQIKPQLTHESDGICDHLLTMGTHVGTHIDAPAHMIEGGKTLDEFSLEQMSGSGVVIDVRGGYSTKQLSEIDLSSFDVVLFLTGMSELYRKDSQKYFSEYPAMPEDIARLIVDSGIKVVGVDACSPDHPDYEVHKILLGGGVLILENLANLEQLLNTEFKLYVAPLKLNIDGAPARVFAEVRDE